MQYISIALHAFLPPLHVQYIITVEHYLRKKKRSLYCIISFLLCTKNNHGKHYTLFRREKTVLNSAGGKYYVNNCKKAERKSVFLFRYP